MGVYEKLTGVAEELAKNVLEANNKSIDPKDIANIVKVHAAGATVAGLGTAWLPGLGAAVATATCVGFIWGMYIRINNQIGLKLSKNILQTLAAGVATNLASAAISSIVIGALFSFIPGIGSVGASVIFGTICYALTFASGFVYIKLITNIFKAKKAPENYSAEDLKTMAEETIKNENMKDFMKKAKEDYKKAKENGDFDKSYDDLKVDE